jgi:hypothetical protein
MTIGQQWTTVTKAFTLKDLTVEQKEELFARQAKIDSSDTVKSKRIMCDALKSTKEDYEKLYLSYKDKANPLSFTLKKASMSGFNNWAHIDRINEEYGKRFFDDLPEVAGTFNGAAGVMFIKNLAPVGDDLPRYIEAW